jgi:hypothetical protein
VSLHSQQIIQNFMCICRAQGVRDDAHAAREATGVTKANLLARPPPDTHPLSITSHHLETPLPSPSDQPDTHPAPCSHRHTTTGHVMQESKRERRARLKSIWEWASVFAWNQTEREGDRKRSRENERETENETVTEGTAERPARSPLLSAAPPDLM